MSKRMINLKPYAPLKGVNLDEDSLMIGQGMCVDIENLRLEGHQLSQRPALQQYGQDSDQVEDAGTLVGDSYDPTVTPIDLTAHSFAGDAGYNIDTGSVYVYWTDAGTLWEITDDGSGNLEDADSNVVGSINYTTGACQLTDFPTKSSLQYAPTANTDCIIYQSCGIENAITYPFSSDRALLMKLYRDPEQDVVQFYFLEDDIVKYNTTTQGYESIVDAGVSFSDIKLWSAVQFTDTNIGATMVAAGTKPPASAMENESDGDDRVLLYYEKDAGTFKDLVQYQEMDEATGDTIEDGDTWTGGSPLTMTAASLTPIKSASAIVHFVDGDYTWELTTNASDEVLDPDENVVGSIDLDSGVVTLNDMPERDSGNVTYAPASANTPVDMWLKYSAKIEKKPRFIFNLNNRIIMVNIYNQEWDGSSWGSGEYQPWRVRWTNILDMTLQDIDSDYVDNVGGDISPYVGGDHIGNVLMLYRINSIEHMFYVGGDNTFQFKTSQNEGIYAGQSVARYKGVHYYLGKNNIYIYDGNTARPIGTKRIIKYLQGVIDENQINRTLGFLDPVNEEYWLLPVQTTDTNAPSQAFVYKITQDAWTIYDFGKEIAYVSFLTEYSSEPVLATYDGYVAKITDDITSDQYMAYSASDQGHVLQDTNITGHLETRDFVVGDMSGLERILKMVFEARSELDSGETIDVSYSRSYGSDWNNVTSVSLDSNLDEREYWLDSTQKRIRFKFEFSNYFVLRYMQLSGIKRDFDVKEED